MKILSAKTAFSTEKQSEQLDLSLHEKISKKQARNTLSIQGPGRADPNRPDPDRRGTGRSGRNRAGGARFLDRVLVNRVSIQSREQEQYQSNYSSNMSTHSKVTSVSSGEMIEYSQQYAMEKLVGGVIDKQVAINSIQNSQDVKVSKKNIDDSGAILNRLPQIQNRRQTQWEMSIKQTDIHFEEENLAFASTGQVTTEDGRIIDFSLDFSMNRTFLSRKEEETLIQRWQESVVLTDPLVISLDGTIPQLSDAQFEFDLDSDGEMENINFINSGSGFLAFDKNGDGIINDGTELFGPGTGNGFEELAAYDLDQNNWIDENDAIFSQLSVWTKDDQGNDKLVSLKEAGLGAIGLDYAATTFNLTQADNTLQGQMQRTGAFLFENGQVGTVHQIDLVSHQSSNSGKISENQKLQNSDASPQIESGLQRIPPGSVIEQPEPEDADNQLKELLDRIEKIKEEMGHLYKSMNAVSGKKRSKRSRGWRSHGISMDSSFLSGYHHRRGLRTSRYV